ncbi:MAG: hypothetical protein NTW86_02510, partial [Candidatus Sumerlaeota bacterium]|nr:hypothetical protein [Candidatus Sumerlaeota bacterium]
MTANLDLAAPGEIVALLRRAALEIFDGGPAGEPALRDERFAEGIERLGRWMAQAWAARPPRLVLITGAGTSGRLAGFLAARFNAVLSRAGLFPCFRADMAGGPEAFFRSIEGAEDDGPAGAERWRMESRLQAESSIARFESMRGIPPEGGTPYLPIGLTIGVTCGLSAPYVAGMLDAALDGRGCRAAILGFVAPQQARSSPALADGRSVRDVVERLASSPRGLVLTTELGPEPLTGSTRMKGGAATIAALCAAFLSALGRASITRTLSRMRRAIEATETIDSTLARLVEAGGRTLRHGGRIAYLGRGGAGLLGVIDASECTPTFGDDPRTVRGFCFPGGVGGLAPLLAPDGLLAGRTELARPASGEVFREMMEEALHSPWLAVQLQNEAEVWSPAFRWNAANRIQAGHRAFRLKAGLHTPD